MTTNPIDIVFTDLDGTLRSHRDGICRRDVDTLATLGRHGVVRVLVTGRSLYSLAKDLAPEFPLDFVIFSTGLGVMDWQAKKIIRKIDLDPDPASTLARYFAGRGINFMVHLPVPDNHVFFYHPGIDRHPDFEHRLKIYADWATPFSCRFAEIGVSSQLLAIIDPDEALFNTLRDGVHAVAPDAVVIRTTSPLDHQSIWVEVFPPTVSKGSAAAWLCDHLDCNPAATVGIGNDYNDLELLDWTHYSFVVSGAPAAMCARFETVAPPEAGGFSAAIARFSYKNSLNLY